MGSPITAFFAGTLGAAMVAVCAAAAVNWSVDSEVLFHDDFPSYEAVAAEVLRSPTGSIFNGNMRRMKLAITLQSDADCYISGSSHSMGFNAANWDAPADYGCRKTLNAGVYYSAFEDFVILAATALDKPQVKTLFIGFDPWIVHQRDKNGMFKTINVVHEQSRKRLGLPDGKYPDEARSDFSLYSQLLNFSYLVRNVRVLYHELSTGRPNVSVQFLPVQPDYSNVQDYHEVIRQDGSRMRARDNIKLLLSQGPYFDGSVLGPPNVKPEVVGEIREIVRLLQASGKRIVFLLTPYSPEVWECRPGNAATCNALVEVEALARDLGREQGVDIYGSYDARRLGVETADFLDGQHIRDEANRKVVRTSP